MNVLQKLSRKNLLLNRKRTISTMVGIILSSALICATCTLGTSFRASLVKNAISETGYYHISLEHLSAEDLAELESNRDFSKIMTITSSGTAVLEGCQNESKPYTTLYTMDLSTFKALNFNLTEGRFPENEDEIIISRHMLTNGQLSYNIGDSLTLEIGTRQSLNGYALDSSNPFLDGEEEIVNTVSHTYSIVGIIERPDSSFEAYSNPCYTTITVSAEASSQSNITAFLVLKNPLDYQKSFVELLGINSYTDIKHHSFDEPPRYQEYDINQELLRWEVFAFSDSTVLMLISVLGVVIFIIMFSSIFCIRNSFAIATMEKIRMYGMLASVGATKRQIRRSVIYEGFLLGIAAIPIGIFSGVFADYILLKIVNVLLGDALLPSSDLILSVNVLILLFAVLLCFLTIYFSAISSAKKASKVSPIAQLRNAQEIQLNEQKLRIPKWVHRLFQTGGVLAYKNLKRSKKKYRTTVVSLAISILTFITMNVFIENAFRSSDLYFEDYEYNMVVNVYNQEELIENDIAEIRNLEHAKEVYVLYNAASNVHITDAGKFNYNPEEETELSLSVLALDDASFRSYTEKIGGDYEILKNTGILCDDYLTYDPQKDQYQTYRIYNYEKGETITGVYNQDENLISCSVEVGFITDIRPYGNKNHYYNGGFLIVDQAYSPLDLEFRVSVISIQSDDADALETQIQKLNSGFRVTNYDKQVRQEHALLMVISIFLYGFITVITLIGITNIFNTITSNMELRQKEFAMLKSIGMTHNEFNRMIRLETLFYSAKALLYGILMSILGTIAIYQAFSIKMDTGIYIPIVPTIISGIFVFVFVFAIMKYSMHKIGRQNIIETIRSENI